MFRRMSLYQNMTQRQALLYERLTGVLRLLFLMFSCLVFALLCIRNLEGVDVWIIAAQMRHLAPRALFNLPPGLWVFVVPFWDWQYFRYLLAPFGAFVLVFLSSVFYVRDIYHLPRLGRAFRYVFASLFGLFYPIAQIEGGRIDEEDPDDESDTERRHLLRAIGGPGLLRIQPGNAVAFRDWQQPLSIQDNQLYFMRPFEMISKVVNLEDQHGHLADAAAITRDGIRLRLRNIDYRFSILGPDQQNNPLRRNQATPYPYSADAVRTIAYSFTVSDSGLDRWYDVIRGGVGGALRGFINNHELDYLTAPRQDEKNPRRELRMQLFAAAVRDSLRGAGAELHWMDIGQFDIDNLQEDPEQHPVDEARTRFWATRWVGDANTIRAYGEATHTAYQELARAQAQAEIVMSITDALRNIDFGADRAETLRHIFLARTAQILEALRDGTIRGNRQNGQNPSNNR